MRGFLKIGLLQSEWEGIVCNDFGAPNLPIPHNFLKANPEMRTKPDKSRHLFFYFLYSFSSGLTSGKFEHTLRIACCNLDISRV